MGVGWPVLSGIILAAGDSTRMGVPKALLSAPDGRPFVAYIVRKWHAAGLTHIVVVTGRAHDAIAAALDRDAPVPHPLIAQNTDPSRGQLSSLIVGLDAIATNSTEGVLMTLVDVPLASRETVAAVIEAWRRTRAPIVRPAIGDRHGHPVLFDRSVLEELRRAPATAGAKAVVRAHEDRIVNIEVSDEGCVVDIDTPSDYERYLKRYRNPPQNW
jgi:molybdenum cofactor cytidylyltransferase